MQVREGPYPRELVSVPEMKLFAGGPNGKDMVATAALDPGNGSHNIIVILCVEKLLNVASFWVPQVYRLGEADREHIGRAPI